MANILSLALKVTADASGLKLDPVQRALVNLGDQADKLTGQFDKFAAGSAGAARAQQEFANRSQELINNLRDGGGATQFAAAFEKLAEEARNATAAFEEGARVTASVRTEEEKRAVSLQRLSSLLDQGAIDAETYARSVAASSSGFNGTQFARFSEAIAPLQRSLQEGTISLEQFQRSAAGIADSVAGSTSAAQRSAEAILELKSRLDAGSISLSEYRAQFSQIQSGNFTSKFELQVVGVREGVEATEKLQAAVSSLQGTQIEAALRVSGTDTLNDLRQQFDGIDGREIDAVLKILGVDTVDDARERLAVIDGTTVEAQLKAVGIESIEQAQRIINGLEGKDITVLAETLGATSVEQLTAIINAVESRTVTVETSTNADDTAAKVAALVSEQEAYKQLLQEGARITEQFRTEEEKRAETLARLDKLLAQAAITEETYNRAVAQASGVAEIAAAAERDRASVAAAAAKEQAEAFAEGERIQRQYGDSVKNTEKEIERLTKLYDLGAIDVIAYNNATADLLGLDKQAAESAKKRADAQAEAAREAATLEAEAARIRQSNLNAQERFDIAVGRASELRQRGLLTEQDFNRELEKQSRIFAKNSVAADGLANSIEKAGDQTLKFNELSGVLAVLPGPLGNIAGRISGISSASEGLSRIFAGGLKTGFSNLASAAASLINPLTVAAAGFAAFAAAASAVINTVNRVSDEVERLSLLADRAGVSFEFIQVLEVAAVKSGTSVDNLSGSFNRFLRSVDDARTGSKGAEAAFASLGISIDDLSSQDPERLFTEAARAISQIEDPATRAATAMEIFGKAGTELLPVFEELATARQDLERLGTAISERQKQNLLEYNNELDRLGIASKGAGNQLASAFAPALGDVTRALNEGIAAANRFSQKYPVVSEALADSLVSQIPVVGTLRAIGDALGFVTNSAERAQQVADIEKQLEARKAMAEEEQQALEAQQKLVDSIVLDLSKGIDESAKFGQAGFDAALKYQDSIGNLRKQLDRGIINDETFRREAKKAAEAFNTELDVVKDAAKDVEAIIRRVDGLIAKANEIPQIEQDLNAVDAEIARTEAALAAARESGTTAQADALAARLSQLDQLQAGLQDTADQAAQGFSQGFDSAFANVDSGINSLIDKATEFGQAGFDAAKALQDGIAAAKEQVRDGILSKPTFDKEVERQKRLYEQRIDQLKAVEKLSQDIAKRQDQLDDKRFEITQARAEELANIQTGSIKVNDLRSGGISAFFDALKEDPAIAEAKKQTKELEKLRQEIAKLNAEKVDILAGTG